MNGASMLGQLQRGADVDGFILGEQIHSGAMGNIYRVTRAGRDGPMIMKVPRVGPNEPAEGIISFETEATVLPALSGPYVPHCVAVGDLARTPYLVTDFVEGESLDELLRRGRLPPDEVARLGAALADALHSLHQQEAVHLDVKPANVIVKRDGTVVLVDFGFAHHARYPDLLAEETRFSAGSAPYISPEQILGRRDDPRSDVFALGVVLYELLTSGFPFGEPDTDVRNRLWLDPIPPRTAAPATPPWLQEIVLRCLEPDAEARYQSAAHVAFDLRHPGQVVLTNRATKSGRAGLFGQLRRFLRARSYYAPRLRNRVAQPSRFPIVMVAVDTMHLDDERHPAMQRVAAQILSLSTEFRVICISVVPAPPSGESNVQLEHLIRLRHWTEHLRLPPQRLSLHVIASTNPAEALLEFARRNNVDLILLGAPAPHDTKPWWRSVASTVTANAHCSVHIVRVAGQSRGADL
jgi:serine/threonine protein kinase